MAKHPAHKPKSSIAQLKAWGMKRLKRILLVSGAVATLSAGLVGWAKAWPIIEPWWYASHGYVRYEVHQPLLSRIIDIQLAQNDSRVERLVEQSKRYEVEIQGEQAKQLPQYRKLLQERIDRTNHELKTIDEQNKSLFNEKISK
jgi:uncharacterized protein (UPF0335 family)